MGFNYASTTLMKKIMILKCVSMPTLRCSNHMETILLKDDLKKLNLDDELKATSKDHPTYLASHLESTAECTKSKTMKNQSLRATKI